MDTLRQDVRTAVRSLRRSPSFTIAAVLAIGLGTGAAAGVFSMLEGVVLRPLPYRRPQELVALWETNKSKGLGHEPVSPVNFIDYRSLRGDLSDLAGWWRPEINLVDDESGDPIRVTAIESTRNLFNVLGVHPFIGHGFSADTGLDGDVDEAIISYRLWTTRFGGDRDVIGRAVRLNGYLYTIVGVMPEGFSFPGDTDLWEGLTWEFGQHSRGAHFVETVGRLAPGVPVEQVNRDLAALGSRLEGEYRATNLGWSSRVVPLDREVSGVFRPALFALLAAAALLLGIACINVANLLLARATSRKREVAVRAAIGASRGQLVRLFLVESAVLAAVGSLLGLLVAWASVKGLLAWSPIQVPRAAGVGVDVGVLAFAALVAAATVVGFGLGPALLASRTELQDTLREGAKGASTRLRGMRSALVVAEVSLAVVLLCGAGLLVRSVERLLGEKAGIDPTSAITADIQLPDKQYEQWERVDQFFISLTQSLRSQPGVTGVGTTEFLPLAAAWRMPFFVAGAAPVPMGDEPTAQHHVVDEGFFAALHVEPVAGRVFDSHDDAKSIPVALVNEALAKQLWPGQNAVGKHIITHVRNIGPLGLRVAIGDDHEIVGVVPDIKNTSLKNAAEPALYFSSHQFPFRKVHVVVRGQGEPQQLAAALRDAVRRIDPRLPVANIQTMERVLSATVDPPRFVMLISSIFALFALALAAVGIYGVLTYAVGHRRREIGIRLALGAEPGAMMRMVVREGVLLAALGALIGGTAALAAARGLSSFLYGVAPWDPVTLIGVLLIVLAVAAVACLLPGRRAAAEDPALALRQE